MVEYWLASILSRSLRDDVALRGCLVDDVDRRRCLVLGLRDRLGVRRESRLPLVDLLDDADRPLLRLRLRLPESDLDLDGDLFLLLRDERVLLDGDLEFVLRLLLDALSFVLDFGRESRLADGRCVLPERAVERDDDRRFFLAASEFCFSLSYSKSFCSSFFRRDSVSVSLVPFSGDFGCGGVRDAPLSPCGGSCPIGSIGWSGCTCCSPGRASAMSSLIVIGGACRGCFCLRVGV